MTALRLRLRPPTAARWADLGTYDDRTVFQTEAWLAFLAESQKGQIVVADVLDGATVVGRFSGLVVARFGVRMLGSSFPGWTTPYIGFNLREGYARRDALGALERFAFGDLGVLHIEVSDRGFVPEDGAAAGFQVGAYGTYESDLTRDEATLFAAMSSACRRCVRKAEKSGVRIEHADQDAFADEYYAQLQDVFAKQGKVPTYPVERVRALVRHTRGTDDALLLRALAPDGTCIGTGIYPAHNRVAEFWGNASWREYQHYRPNEALHWYAMRYWKARGVTTFDWGGGGAYKEKYGVVPATVPWFRKSRFRTLELLRSGARRAFDLRQRLVARARLGADGGRDTVREADGEG
jgi:hypothetical protein